LDLGFACSIGILRIRTADATGPAYARVVIAKDAALVANGVEIASEVWSWLREEFNQLLGLRKMSNFDG
jgi:hypothetical protein